MVEDNRKTNKEDSAAEDRAKENDAPEGRIIFAGQTGAKSQTSHRSEVSQQSLLTGFAKEGGALMNDYYSKKEIKQKGD